ncbi:MAG: clostripain-related cysteine peptidase, partial [Butyrivibrio sp.]|nr:clostripain-related cysteine peptidase [Butyrivibrio sp.]
MEGSKMFCKKCGNQLNDNARFCPKCGQETGQNQQVQNTQTPAQPDAYSGAFRTDNGGSAAGKPAKKKKRKMPVIIAVVVVVIGFFWLIGSSGSSSTDSVATDGSGSSAPAGSGNTEAVNSGNAAAADNSGENGSTVSSAQDEIAQTIGQRGTNLSISADGELLITRITDSVAPTTVPDDGIWTVFVYMCGSNLETYSGSATRDLQEMLNATESNSNLQFVVEAGGANAWQNDICVDGQNTRLLISEGTIQMAESETANMGDPNTLYDFLDWGLANFCSQYMVLDFWDHGGASITGVCFDEREPYNDDGLSLMEIDQTLASLYNKYALQYEMIGCDACLMSTIEMANILVPYANYMIASEENEPGGGWDYTGFGNGVKANVKNGAELGKYICDAYIASCYGGNENTATLSVIDLAKLDRFLIEFNSCCIEIYDYLCLQNGIDNIMSGARRLPSFGKKVNQNGDVMSSNSTDLGLFLKTVSAYSDKAEGVLALMEECVVYMRNGAAHRDVGGVAVYFPLDYSVGSKHLAILKNICVTPYYMGIVDVCAYGKDNAGDISGYDSEQWVDEDNGYWSDDNAGSSGQDAPADDSTDTS